MPVVLAELTPDALDVQAHLNAVDDARQGATATFIGTVRNHDPEVDGEVVRLDYSAHPSAARLIREIAERICGQYDTDGVIRVAVSHRIGRLAVGEIAIVAAVSSPHRALAFSTCSAVVEEIKENLPIWKQQFRSDGDGTWSGLPA